MATARRSRTLQTTRGTEISIPARRNLPVTMFFGIWLCGWAAGEVMVLAHLFRDNEPTNEAIYSIVWLSAWTIAGVCFGTTWAWITFGRTFVEATKERLLVRRHVLGMGFTRSYDAKRIERLRPRIRVRSWLWERWPDGESPFAGTISFEYEGKTVNFGAGLGEAEADMVIDELRQILQLKNELPAELE